MESISFEDSPFDTDDYDHGVGITLSNACPPAHWATECQSYAVVYRARGTAIDVVCLF